MPRITARFRLIFLTLCVLILPGLSASAAARRHASRVHRKAAPIRPAVAGLVVARDPRTGALGMPSDAQLLELSAQEKNMISRSTAGLTEVRLPGGGGALDLRGRFQEFSVIRIGPGGRKTFECVSDSASLKQALEPAGAPVPAAEER